MNTIFFTFLLSLSLSAFCQNKKTNHIDLHSSECYKKYQLVQGSHDGIIEYYYTNGNIQAIVNYKFGKLNGSFKSYYANGAIQSEGYFKNNKRKGFWKFYFQDGKVKQKSNYRYGKLRGYFRSYYKSGQMKSEGNFIDIEEKQGLWKYYDKNGKLREEQVYKDGTLVEKKWFNENGPGPFQPSKTKFSKYTPLSRTISKIN